MTLSVPQVPASGLLLSAEETTSLSEQEEGQEMTTQLPFVGGPRPTMTKLQVNYYISLLLFYLSVVCTHMCPSAAQIEGSNWLLTIIPVISCTHFLLIVPSRVQLKVNVLASGRLSLIVDFFLPAPLNVKCFQQQN